MKKTIEDHKYFLLNRTTFLESKRLDAEKELIKVEEMENLNRLYKAQIDLAVKEKKDGFDEQKYAIKRLCV
jgi:hypothetical protein